MNEQQIKNIVEGALLAAGRPLSLDELATLFAEDECPDRSVLRATLEILQDEYAGRAFELKEVASGFRLQVRAELSLWISRLWIERPSRYSRALLETMALVAYRQPITRGEIEDIRGVSVSSSIMKTLQERDWVRVVGHRDVPGRPAMYATTKTFLDYFNLKSLDELPTLAELRDIDSINAELDLTLPGAPDAGQGTADPEAGAAHEDAPTGEETWAASAPDARAGEDAQGPAADPGPEESRAEAQAPTVEAAGRSAATKPDEAAPVGPEAEDPSSEAVPASAARDEPVPAADRVDAAEREAKAGDVDDAGGGEGPARRAPESG